jgi:hypothetical protein
MRLVPAVVLAGAAGLCLAGAAAAQRHVMTVDLPSGGVAQIAYDGDAAPVVKVVKAGDPSAMPMARDPFAGFDRMMAEMRARHVAMMREAAALAARAGDAGGTTVVDRVAAGNLPAGSYSYTFISTRSGNGTCGRVVQITARPNAAPQRVARSFGDCGEGATPAPAPAAPARPAPRPALPTT